MSLIASLPYDLALDIGIRVEEIRLRTYFTECVLPDIPCEVESINQQRKELHELHFKFWARYYPFVWETDFDWDQHFNYERISPNQRCSCWWDRGVFLYWVLDEDGDWIVDLWDEVHARDRCW